MSAIDIVVFVTFVAVVIGVGLYKSKGESTHGEHGAANYFLAGRGLSWWLIGFSLIAAARHLHGAVRRDERPGRRLAGRGHRELRVDGGHHTDRGGVRVPASTFLQAAASTRCRSSSSTGINAFARTIMAVSTMIILVGVPTASVIYSGAKVICVYFAGTRRWSAIDLGNIAVGCWIIGIAVGRSTCSRAA